jgi:hypothetical protein
MIESPSSVAIPDAPAGEPAPQAMLSVPYLEDALEDAELLLGHSAVGGIEVSDDIRDSVLEARIANDSGQMTEKTAANLLKALTSLAASVKPESAKKLRGRKDRRGPRATIKFYGIMAGLVGGLIIAISMLTYFSSSVADKIKMDIDTANGLASKLRSELGPAPSDTAANAPQAPATSTLAAADKVWYGSDATPPGLSDRDIISDLQQFAATMREIDGYSRQLKFFVGDFSDPQYSKVKGSLELKPGLDRRLSIELTEKVKEYQNVRTLGDNVQEKVTVYYGAIATCILPVLYALLGAGAYLLRMFEDQSKTNVSVAANRHVARFLIAGIGGLVVGLFNNFTSSGITFSPFAVAFLVGYAADVFFTFLEGLLQIFKRAPAGSGAAASTTTT